MTRHRAPILRKLCCDLPLGDQKAPGCANTRRFSSLSGTCTDSYTCEYALLSLRGHRHRRYTAQPILIVAAFPSTELFALPSSLVHKICSLSVRYQSVPHLNVDAGTGKPKPNQTPPKARAPMHRITASGLHMHETSTTLTGQS